MKIIAFWLAVLLMASAAAGWADNKDPKDNPVPLLDRVEPCKGKAGDVAIAYGQALDKGRVAEVFFTDGKTDLKVEILEQTATMIKFKIPVAPARRYWLMLLTKAVEPALLEQPVVVTVE